MPLQETSGAASYDAFGGGVPVEPVYIEQIFSTYLYTGTGASLPIVNGIDLDAEGGLVWTKSRTSAAQHKWYDSARGVSFAIESNTTDANQTEVTGITSFNSNGYTYGTDGNTNSSGTNYASWTFRKQPKFFDIVTYTGNGSNRTIAHNLGSVPGCIIVKKTSGADNWFVQHRSLGATKYIALNDADIAYTNSQIWNNTEPTSTVFTLGTNSGVNQSGATYVAYLFAHNAGGFGLTGTDNVISCGGYAGTDAELTVNLGWEPQWILVKQVTASSGVYGNWQIFDNMRGLNTNLTFSSPPYLEANTSDAESTANPNGIAITSTGFKVTTSFSVGGWDYIYIAIRRGPMKVPTSGTEVFSPALGNGASGSFDTSFPVDFGAYQFKLGGDPGAYTSTRLLANGYMQTGSTNAEAQFGSTQPWDRMEDWYATADNRFIGWGFRRAPGFFDVVCYTGNDTARTLTHNLAAVPELMIVKSRSATGNWSVYVAATTATNVMYLNTTNASFGASGYWNNTAPTASVFTIGNTGDVNNSGTTFVAYLFATVAGVSKVGSYTGTGTTQVINCGFTAGSRFVMIKRTDSTGDWYVWDSARGIVAGNDPYLLLNSTAAEVTNTDYVDTAATGFEISSTAPAAINANGGTFIFLAIA